MHYTQRGGQYVVRLLGTGELARVGEQADEQVAQRWADLALPERVLQVLSTASLRCKGAGDERLRLSLYKDLEDLWCLVAAIFVYLLSLFGLLMAQLLLQSLTK